jgi:hypothetical protein
MISLGAMLGVFVSDLNRICGCFAVRIKKKSHQTSRYIDDFFSP